MANIYKKVNTDLITNTEQSVYTAASNTRALIKSIHVYNEGAGAIQDIIERKAEIVINEFKPNNPYTTPSA